MDVAEHRAQIEEKKYAQQYQDQLGPQVEQRQHQVDQARLLDADDVDGDQQAYQHHGPPDVPCEVLLEVGQHADVATEVAQVGDRGIGADGDGGGVVEELHPAHQESNRLVEGAAREARGATRMGHGGGALRVVEGGGDEDGAGQDQGQRRQAQCKGRRDAQRVVDRGADVAVAGAEERAHAQRARQLGATSHDHPIVAGSAPPLQRLLLAHGPLTKAAPGGSGRSPGRRSRRRGPPARHPGTRSRFRRSSRPNERGYSCRRRRNRRPPRTWRA